ncbi:hypothetical protein [Ilumatobacter nonamiensis]|uniref:hypothetical protein n=1 Tax=Ilumatobacter nonamiensis TaxID=467093 RepID=UPI000590F9C3|nr:hypothetical protein [Ilumatobacter nonamiensis]
MAVLPSVDFTNFDVAAANRTIRGTGDAVASTATDVARDALHIAVGLGVLTYQRLQVRRREIERAQRR